MDTFLDDLNSLASFSIARFCLAADPLRIQLHGFCDSSIRGYGCSIYLRVEDIHGNILCNLLTAKSRVAPIKKKSLPKLELCGAKLLSALYDSIKSTLKREVSEVFL